MDPFVGEIRLVGFNFAPRNWALCNGQLLAISQNTALFSLLGTTYGGNGQTTFALPDLRGRAIVHAGQGPGLSPYSRGQISGTENVTLLPAQMPAHTHSLAGTALLKTNNGVPGNSSSPVGNYLATAAVNEYGEETSNKTMLAGSVGGSATLTGGSVPHDNRMPYLSMYYVIALQGIYPQRP